MGVFHATPPGTPQGGVISPLLVNIALHGMEAALGVSHNTRADRRQTRAVVRYADDFVVFCETEEDAERVKDELLPPGWPSGACPSPGEDPHRPPDGRVRLPGLQRQALPAPQTTRTGYKLLIRPSKKAVKRPAGRSCATNGSGLWGPQRRGGPGSLNPIIRGWANYYRTVVSKSVFETLDNWMFTGKSGWARHTHPQQAMDWLKRRYWGS